MDAITQLAITVVLAGVSLYVLYWVIRRAVAAGIRDVQEDAEVNHERGE